MAIPHVSFSDERLDNGLRLVIAEDHLAPVAAVNIWYNVGSRHEVPGKTGFAHLFEHVMFQGSRNVGKAEHIAIVQAAGGVMNGTTWFDRTNYFETMPAHQLEVALWLEADRMGTLLEALSQENLDNQREVVKNEKRWSYDNQPYGSFFERLLAQLYPPGHPYSHPTIGSMDDLDAASLEDVQTFFRTYYAPNNAVLAVVGDVDREQVRGWVRHYFEPLAPSPDIPPLPDMALPLTLGGVRRETVPDRVELARVHVGYRAPLLGDQRLYALELASRILSGGKGSRLHRRMVRTDRIAQDVAMFPMPVVAGASMLIGWATVRPGVDPSVVEATLLEEIERLRVEPVTPDELERAKALMETAMLADLQRVESLADSLAMWATLFDDPGLVNEQLDRYLAVDAEGLLAAAAEVFDRDNLAILTYIPEGSAGDARAADTTTADQGLGAGQETDR